MKDSKLRHETIDEMFGVTPQMGFFGIGVIIIGLSLLALLAIFIYSFI